MWVSTEKIYNGMIILGSALLVCGSLLLTNTHLKLAEDAEEFASGMFSLLDDEKDAVANAAATAAGE